MSRVNVTTINHQHHSSVFIVNFEQIPHTVLVFPLLTLSKKIPAENTLIFTHYHARSDRLQSILILMSSELLLAT